MQNMSQSRTTHIIAVTSPNCGDRLETFIRSHIERLPARVLSFVGYSPAEILGQTPGPIALGLTDRIRRAVETHIPRRRTGADADLLHARVLARHWRREGVELVLAEYGVGGASIWRACQLAALPLAVHFHGFDAYSSRALTPYGAAYHDMFAYTGLVVAVSEHMRQQLISLGAPVEKILLNPYGVDLRQFHQGNPGSSDASFLAVGRFVEKKAPQLTLLAFRRVLDDLPSARLTMVGDGPLLGACRQMAASLGMAHATIFPGALPHQEVAALMGKARGFVQHSLRASDGDCEGTPVAILEAGASGLPTVATRHCGIPEVVTDGQTGFLVAEGDIQGMASAMLQLASSPDLASAMGRKARLYMEQNHDVNQRIGLLWNSLSALMESAHHRS